MAHFPMPSFTKTVYHKAYPAIDPRRSELSATGKNILITGAGTGIGAAIAEAFAQANAKNIAIIGRRRYLLEKVKEKLESSTSTNIHVFEADVVDEKAIIQVFSNFKANLGPIDVCVSNAVYDPEPVPVENQDVNDFARAFDVNVKGAFMLTQQFLRTAAKDGVLINISAATAHVPPFLGLGPGPLAAYTSGKAATAKFMEFVQAERQDLRVVSVHPGIVYTQMAERSGAPNDPSKYDEAALPGGFCVWVASPQAAFLKGRFVWANWDVTELMERQKEVIANPMLLTLSLGGWPFK